MASRVWDSAALPKAGKARLEELRLVTLWVDRIVPGISRCIPTPDGLALAGD